VSSSSELLEAALAHAKRGWHLFPVEPGGKRPLGRLAPHGLKDATTDADTIRAWWTAEPKANIGLPTGIHFDVLDLDGSEAMQRFDACMPLADDPDDDELLEGPTVKTPRGWHVYVAPSGRGNTVNVGGIRGVDWRGIGGYVVAPPSVRDDGASWSWITGTPFDLGPDTPIRPAPAWVLDLFDRRAQRTVAPIGTRARATASAYANRALEAECGRVILAPVGSRNDAVNRAAFALGQLVGAGALEAAVAADALVLAAVRAGLDEVEARRTIASGMRAGVAQPRRVSA
jgi:hypothetical protein